MTKSQKPQAQDALFHLREDVYFEPLVHQWYAWPYLIPPVTAALNLTARNLRLMKSFVANAQLHIAANQNAELTGGDFVDCSPEQVEDVRRLIIDLEQNHPQYFEIRRAVTALNSLLEQQTGMSLEALYQDIPDILRGYVELYYDMNHHASFRLIEGLIYRGTLYQRSAQRISLGCAVQGKERPFVLSSPRLPDKHHIQVKVELADPWIDRLSDLRRVPINQAGMDALFAEVATEGGLDYRDLFTCALPLSRHSPVTSEVRVSFLGHAGLMLETPQVTILVDPVITCHDGEHNEQMVSFGDLPASVDYICITHTHMDHTCIESLLQLRSRIKHAVLVPKNTGNLADPSIKLMLQTLGFKVRELEEMDEVAVPNGRIVAIPFLGEHADLNIRSKSAWYIELEGKKIFAGADSASLDQVLYRRIHEQTGNLDMLFIGMECVGAPMSWLYGALFTKPVPRAINESRRFNGSDFALAKHLVDIFQPSYVGIYALGLEPWFRYFMGVDYQQDARQIVESDQLLAYCAERQITADRLAMRRVWTL